MSDKPVTHVKKGLVISLVLIVLGTIFYFTGAKTNGPSQYVLYAIVLGGVVWGCVSFAKERDGNITFGNVFGHGFKISAVIACVMVVYSLAFGALFPEIKTQALEETRVALEQNPQFTDEQIDMFVKGTDEYYTIIQVAGALFGFLFMGVIASLVGAGVARKNPPSPFKQSIN